MIFPARTLIWPAVLCSILTLIVRISFRGDTVQITLTRDQVVKKLNTMGFKKQAKELETLKLWPQAETSTVHEFVLVNIDWAATKTFNGRIHERIKRVEGV